MFRFVIEKDHVEGVVNGVAPQQVTNSEYTNQLAALLNRKVRFNVDSNAIQVLFGKDRSTFLLEGQKVSSRAQQLGFEFKYPTLDLALRSSINESYKYISSFFRSV